MIRFVTQLAQGRLYGFGLSEVSLNRLEFNNELIVFSFHYAGLPQLFGVILYMEMFKEPADIFQNPAIVASCCLPLLDPERGITLDSLRAFPMAQSVMKKLREKPGYGLESHIEISKPGDKQVFLAGRDEEDIKKHIVDGGYIPTHYKNVGKGFWKY